MSSKRKNYFDGSGTLTAYAQAQVAYGEMRRSLIKYAEVEAEIIERRERGEQFTALQESLIIGRLHAHRDRVRMFALVYQVEMDVHRSQLSKVGIH